jgi:hypothetical protein
VRKLAIQFNASKDKVMVIPERAILFPAFKFGRTNASGKIIRVSTHWLSATLDAHRGDEKQHDDDFASFAK